MKSNLKASILSLLILGAAMPFAANAQNFYDDDIYDASKPVEKPAKTAPARQQQTTTQTVPSLSGTGYYYGGDGNIYPEYKAAGSYDFNSGNMRDVDEYNRRGIFARSNVDSIPADSLYDNFAYTNRLERFHNHDIVAGSDDEELKELYYTNNQAPTTTINVYVQDSWPYYYNPYRLGYFGPSWSLSWGFGYRPWVSWGWGWGYDPYWDWGPSWAWGPAWGWGPSWGWAGPSWGWAHPGRPSTGLGSSMTHRPAYAGTHGVRPAAGVGSRPGAGSAIHNLPGAGVGSRPGYNGSSTTRPGISSGGLRPGANVRPGANSGSTTTRPGYMQNRRPSSSSSYNGQGSRPGVQRQQPTYNNNRNTGSYSRPSSGGGSRGGFSGGGSRGGQSGGGGRGSRR